MFLLKCRADSASMCAPTVGFISTNSSSIATRPKALISRQYLGMMRVISANCVTYLRVTGIMPSRVFRSLDSNPSTGGDDSNTQVVSIRTTLIINTLQFLKSHYRRQKSYSFSNLGTCAPLLSSCLLSSPSRLRNLSPVLLLSVSPFLRIVTPSLSNSQHGKTCVE